MRQDQDHIKHNKNETEKNDQYLYILNHPPHPQKTTLLEGLCHSKRAQLDYLPTLCCFCNVGLVFTGLTQDLKTLEKVVWRPRPTTGSTTQLHTRFPGSTLTLITACMVYFVSVTSQGTLGVAGTRIKRKKKMVTQTPLWSAGLVEAGLF